MSDKCQRDKGYVWSGGAVEHAGNLFLTSCPNGPTALGRVLTPYEAKSLVALLHAKDRCIVRRALVTVSNSAAFTANQDLLRESGCLLRLQHLLLHSDLGIQLAAIAAVANMSLSVENQKEMGVS